MQLSVVIPAWNEAESLPELFAEIREVLGPGDDWEVVVVDDGSRDGTFEAVRREALADPRIHGIRLRKNSGKAAALAAGFAAAGGGLVATMDADLQDDPHELPLLREQLESGGLDLVSGWKQVRNDPVDKTLPSKLFNRTVARVSGLDLHDFNCGLKLYRREVLPSLRLYGQLHRFLPVMAHWEGFRVGEKPVNHRPRRYGASKYGWSRMLSGFFDLLTLWFLHRYLRRPLHLFGGIGLGVGFLGMLPLAWFFAEWLATGSLRMRPLLLGATVAEVMAVQFVSLGLLGELVQSRDRTPDPPVAERA